MNRRTLTILLSLSVLFNVCFVMGWAGLGTTATADPADRLAQSLDLTERQRTCLNELRSSMQAETASLHSHVAQLRGHLATLLEEDSPDIDAVRSLVQQISTERLEARTITAAHLSQFIDLLDGKQRRLLGRRLGEGRRHHLPPHIVQQLDTDGDGVVSEQEQDAGIARTREYHDRMRRERHALAEQFDVDGDGTLDEAERTAYREHLLAQGLRVRGGHEGEGRRHGEGRRGDGRRGRSPHGSPPSDGPSAD